jgi:pumilio homology domain family member 6
MAFKDAVAGNKRKLNDKSKDKFSKKPKFDKRAPPQDESEDFSNDSTPDEFSDEQDGGAALNGDDKPYNGGKQSNGANVKDGKVFERGQF